MSISDAIVYALGPVSNYIPPMFVVVVFWLAFLFVGIMLRNGRARFAYVVATLLAFFWDYHAHVLTPYQLGNGHHSDTTGDHEANGLWLCLMLFLVGFVWIGLKFWGDDGTPAARRAVAAPPPKPAPSAETYVD